MKKAIVATSMIFLTILFVSGVYAWNCRGMYGNGYNETGYGGNGYNNQSFYNDTASLRSSIAADKAELNALMAGKNPDPNRARVLSKKISKAEDELRLKAQKYDISDRMGYGMMNEYNGRWGRGMAGYNHTFAGCW